MGFGVWGFGLSRTWDGALKASNPLTPHIFGEIRGTLILGGKYPNLEILTPKPSTLNPKPAGGPLKYPDGPSNCVGGLLEASRALGYRLRRTLVAGFITPQKAYTFRFIGGYL